MYAVPVEDMKVMIVLEPNDVHVLWNINKIDRLTNSSIKEGLAILDKYTNLN